MMQAPILEMLEASSLPRHLVFNVTRALIGNQMCGKAYGCVTPELINLKRGAKQGAPESGLLFVSTLNHLLQTVTGTWQSMEYGCELSGCLLNHMLLVDDVLLFAQKPTHAQCMLRDIQATLARAGLEINEQKTAYLTTNPTEARHALPGTDESHTGMKILGRVFTLTENMH